MAEEDVGDQVGFVDLDDHVIGQLQVGFGHGVLGWQGEYDWAAHVAELGDVAVQGHLHGVLDAEFIDEHPQIPLPKYLILVLALGTLMIGHIFDHPQYLDLETIEHLNALDHINKRQPLRRRDNNGTIQFDLLTDCDLNIAGSWRHVNDEIVELAPVRLIEELGDDLGDHGAAHHGGFVGCEAERHALQAVEFDWLDLAGVVSAGLQHLAFFVDQRRERGAEDIRVEDSHFEA